MDKALNKLLDVVKKISQGQYSDNIMELTSSDNPEHIRKMAEAVGLMMVKIEAREYQLSMLIEELKSLNLKLKNSAVSTLTTIANILATRDVYTEGHTERVAEYAEKTALILNLDEKEVQSVRIGGLLHDIGKIGFPDILFQPHEARNSSELVKEIMLHPQKGFDILQDLEFLGPALEFVYCHHERPDGKGYPRKLKMDDIPLGARIIAVADAYDAMTTTRPYQNPKTKEEAIDILFKMSGKKWDEKCVRAFVQTLNTKEDQTS